MLFLLLRVNAAINCKAQQVRVVPIAVRRVGCTVSSPLPALTSDVPHARVKRLADAADVAPRSAVPAATEGRFRADGADVRQSSHCVRLSSHRHVARLLQSDA